MNLNNRHRKLGTPSFATQLDGASQFWSKTSPTNLDLNGSEMITAADDRGFESTVGNWVGNGNHAVSRSTVDKRTGAASMAIVASAAGDSTTNYASLAFANFGTIVSGTRYTVEGYARSNTATTTISIVVGSKTSTSATLSTVAGSFTKFQLTFEATASEVSQGVKLYLSKAATVYVDDMTMAQGYDVMIVASIKSTVSATSRIAHCRGAGSTGYALNTVVGGGINADVNDGSTTSGSTTSATYTSGALSVVAMTISRDSNIISYLNGAPSGSVSVTGKGIVRAQTIGIGALTGGSAYYSGDIGFVQFVRFDTLPSNIAQIISQITARKTPLSAYPGGQIVAWYDWRNRGFDKSGNGNHLTSTGSPIIRQI